MGSCQCTEYCQKKDKSQTIIINHTQTSINPKASKDFDSYPTQPKTPVIVIDEVPKIQRRKRRSKTSAGPILSKMVVMNKRNSKRSVVSGLKDFD